MTDKENSKYKILKLVKNFVDNKNKFETMKETDIRNKLIDPLFEALGWDIDGKEIPDEVIREETIRTGKTKFIDYTFTINGITKFVVEAKAVSEDLSNSQYVKQVIEYAYNKACLWAVLTDFEGIKIFLVDRDYSETPFYNITISDIPNFERNFEILWKFLSKEGFLSNELENEAKLRGQLKDKIPIDQQLLDDLVIWRKELAADIKMRYKDKYDEDTIDEIVQRIIDRLIFIRKTEDAGVEDRILDQITRREDKYTYGEVKKLFERFNKDYNSKLFGEDAKDEHECDLIDISNNVIRKVIKGLYVPSKGKIEYNFAVIDADILGNIYEQYLSFILKKAGKGAKLVGGKAHRKEQGIYYTPTYIVDYIVRNTLGEVLKTKNPEDIKILDPACGSGSFLLKAFDYLDNYYNKKLGKEKQATLDSIKDGLFTRRAKILKNNVFGVDLDRKAVEIAQLNLLLKMAEDRRRLPTLKQNIKCGNSIVDFETLKSKAFRWTKEFPDIVSKNGIEDGFDIVIGNPPYGAELTEKEREYIAKTYEKSKSYKNTALIFMEKSLSLLKNHGYLGFIVPKSLAFSQAWKAGRDLIKNHLEIIVDVSKAFEDVLLEQVIIILKKNSSSRKYTALSMSPFKSEEAVIGKSFIDKTDSIIIHGNKKDFEIFQKINSQNKVLSDISKTSRGIPLQRHITKTKSQYPVIRGKNIARFKISESVEYLPNSLIDSDSDKIKMLLQPKIVSQRIVAHVTKPTDHLILMSAFDEKGKITVDTVENTIIVDKDYSPEFLVCLLNSKLISWYAYRYIFSKAIRTMDLDDYYIGKIPIPKYDKVDMEIFVKLYNKFIELSNSLSKASKLSDNGKKLQEEITDIGKEIDQKVYELYGLTNDEISVVENS